MIYIRLRYHQALAAIYGRMADSVYEHPVYGMSEEGEQLYLKYFGLYIAHKARVREIESLSAPALKG